MFFNNILFPFRSLFRNLYLFLFPVINKGKNNKVDIGSKLGRNFRIFINGNKTDKSGGAIYSNESLILNPYSDFMAVEDEEEEMNVEHSWSWTGELSRRSRRRR